MKKVINLIFAGTVATTAMAQAMSPAIPYDAEIEAKVQAQLAKMTTEEKIGQMTELAIDLFGRMNPATGKFEMNPEAVDMIISKFKVGSILNAPGQALTPEEWYGIIKAFNDKSVEVMGIPTIYGLDQNHGTTYTRGGILFPQNINVAASFNKDMAREAASITAYETRAGNCPWTYSPTLDMGRDPRWPRQWENFGEDPLVNAEMGVAQVKGFQGDDPNNIGVNNIAACVKHYMGYSAPFSGKDRTPAYISPQDMREKYFAPYLAAIRAGALSVMVNSASVNGVPVHANAELLTKWLKEDLNWDGMIVTDWADINNLFQREKVAKDKKEAIALAINAGIDMTMDPYDPTFCTTLKELVDEGTVSMDRINDAAARVLRMKYRLGLFDKPNTCYKDYPDFDSKAHRATALKAAEESMVLLKNNDNILPLKKGTKILVTGPNGDSMRSLNGGWSYSWQGNLANEMATEFNTIYEALQAKFGKKNVNYVPGVTYDEKGAYWAENPADYAPAVAAAKDADVIVACIGENSYCETPGNLTDLTLSRQQLDLVKALAETGKPIVLVLNEGRPRLITEIEPLAQAVVDILLPGNFGGDALANLMAGDANFSGKMPITYPKEINSLITYDYKVSEQVGTMEGAYDYNAQVAWLWPFGYGLSYTTYDYSNLRTDKSSFGPDDTITVSVDVTNTGNRAGKEAVLLYSSDLIASQVPDNRRLRAFDKIELAPGETKTVTFTLPASDLAFADFHGNWVLEAGDFNLTAGNQTAKVTCNETRRYTTPNK
ncbi:MAG: glycoside hydrolase family 3 C-terminal domain-containing protein [Bacteroides sp.]|nr:glycoside hydrolase family 3 C-terminal domain-containing protein [Bacteroides sp.]MCM1457853.1 glycoside hydrolase family 3 C-terminal domain-containing protein [Lachnoclostridium sp.]